MAPDADYEGRDVQDRNGARIGRISTVYVDEASGRPEWGLVNTGFFGTRHSLVPLFDVREAGGGRLAIPYDKALVHSAPNLAANDELGATEEARLLDHFGLTSPLSGPPSGRAGASMPAISRPGATGAEGAPDPGARSAGWPGGPDVTGAGGPASPGAIGAAATPPEAVSPPRLPPAPVPSWMARIDAPTQAASAALPAPAWMAAASDGRPASPPLPALPPATPTPTEADSVAGADPAAGALPQGEGRSPSAARRPAEQVRVRKTVVSQPARQQVTLRREELRIDRRPLGPGDLAGHHPQIAEEEHLVTLFCEEAVLGTTVVPVEHIRVGAEIVEQEHEVTGEVRRGIPADRGVPG